VFDCTKIGNERALMPLSKTFDDVLVFAADLHPQSDQKGKPPVLTRQPVDARDHKHVALAQDAALLRTDDVAPGRAQCVPL